MVSHRQWHDLGKQFPELLGSGRLFLYSKLLTIKLEVTLLTSITWLYNLSPKLTYKKLS